MKKLNNKGFTLIEIVIVIVIIAILAAMLVPSLTQWIQKSKVKTFTSACGEVRTAVAAQVSEKYANGGVKDVDQLTASDFALISADLGEKKVSNAKADGVDFVIGCGTSKTTDTGFWVQDANMKGTWNGNSWDVEPEGGFNK